MAAPPPTAEASRLLLSSSEAVVPTWGRSDSEPDPPSPGDAPEQCILECEEDGSTLGQQDVCEERAAEHQRFQPVFHAEDARTTIRLDLERQRSFLYKPEEQPARHFASTDRPRIVSWLVEVVSVLGQSDNTLHAAVSLLDRFAASTETMPPEHILQLLALACLSVASKQEEVEQYASEQWIRLAVDEDQVPIYHAEDLKRMEHLLLETVLWRMRVPNTLTFLRHFEDALMHDAAAWAEVARGDPERAAAFSACANFMAEMSLLYHTFLPYGYSTIATACLVLAEWNIKYAEGADAQGPAPLVCTVVTLGALIGEADSNVFAPDLPLCVQAMHQLYAYASTPGPDGLPPSPAALGLIAPIVARYSSQV